MAVINVGLSEKVLILGEFQSGKSTLARHLAGLAKRRFIFDPVWGFGGGHRTLPEAWQSFQTTGHGVYCPPAARGIDLWDEMDAFGWQALEAANAMVLVDEPALGMDGRSAIPPGINHFYRLGHKRGNGIVLATHRFHGDLPALLRMVHHFFIFKTDLDLDVIALRPYLGPAGVEWVMQAPKYHFWHRGGGHNGPVQPLRLPEKPKPAP